MRKAFIFLFIIAITLVSIMLGGCAFGPYDYIEILSIGRAVRPGDVIVFTALGVNSDGETNVVKATWSFSGTAGLLLNSDGPTADFLAVMPGKGTLTAAKGNARGSIEIDVYLPVLTSISITPSELRVAKNATALFSATGLDQHKRPVPCNPEWSVVGAIGVLSSETGTSVTLTTPGIGAEGKIIAKQGDIAAEAAVEVYPLPSVLTSIVIEPAVESMYLGETDQFCAYALDQYLERMPCEGFEWRIEGGIGSCDPASGEATDLSATALGSGRLIASFGGLEGSAEITVAEKITISGIVKDCETGESLSGVEIRVYKDDFKDGVCTDTTFSDDSGCWTFDLPKPPAFIGVIMQAYSAGYFVRTTVFKNVSASGLQMALMPDNLQGFAQFMDETTYERVDSLDKTTFEGFKILLTNPSGEGSLSLEHAEYLSSLFQDDSNGISSFLGLKSCPVSIVTEPYTPGYYEIAIIPDSNMPEGTSSFSKNGGFPKAVGGTIRFCPSKATEWTLKRMLLHGLAHIIYLKDTTARESILNSAYGDYNIFMPLDLKGALISNEPALSIITEYYTVPDYLDKILGTRFGLKDIASL